MTRWGKIEKDEACIPYVCNVGATRRVYSGVGTSHVSLRS